MEIRKSKMNDIETIMKIFDSAREYMIENGNATQWDKGYPSVDILKQDIDNRNSYVMIDNGIIVGTFSLIIGDEPTYQVIEDGQWHHFQEYGTIHRVASSGVTKGIARKCFEFCLQQVAYLRIDTHHDNQSMRSAIKRFGFKECGYIYVRDGSKRIAFDYLKK